MTKRVIDIAAPTHGGDMANAQLRYATVATWLDLSTGLNPLGYVPPLIPPACFERLPGDLSDLIAAASNYYAVDQHVGVVPAPGSQVLIQWLPLLRVRGRVAVPNIGYREHAFRWSWAGHEVVEYDAADVDAIDELLKQDLSIDVLIVINPNNPLGTLFNPQRLSVWLQELQRRGGWLVVDEAFIDVQSEYSVAPQCAQTGLIVLRSIGKFFGLAGVRCGFALCEPKLANSLSEALGPWPVSGPSAFVAQSALNDRDWQLAARVYLQQTAAACAQLLDTAFAGFNVELFCSTLFVSVGLGSRLAIQIQDQLASTGIWVRRIELLDDRALLRFGLVDSASANWRRLQSALAGL